MVEATATVPQHCLVDGHAAPQVARYTGSGSVDDAANFRCEVN